MFKKEKKPDPPPLFLVPAAPFLYDYELLSDLLTSQPYYWQPNRLAEVSRGGEKAKQRKG